MDDIGHHQHQYHIMELVLPSFSIRQILKLRCGRNNKKSKKSSRNTGLFLPKYKPSLRGLWMLFQFLLLSTASVRIWMGTKWFIWVKPRSEIWNKLGNSCWKKKYGWLHVLEKKIVANSECETECYGRCKCFRSTFKQRAALIRLKYTA